MPAGGDSRFRRVPLIPGRPSPTICPTRATCSTAFTSSAGSPKASPWYDREIQRRDPDQRPPTYEPDLFRARFTLLRRADHLTEAHQEHLDRLFDAHPRLRTAWDALQELYQLYEADNPDQANQTLGRFADLYATGQIPEYRQVVDTIIAWGEQILAYHTTRRVSNGPLEGITTSYKSYDESPTGSPTPTIT